MTDDQPKRGRPSDYSFQVAISICARLAEGKSLRAICSEAGMPGRATVFRWIARHKEFRDEYTLACELRAEDLADEMIEIADVPFMDALRQSVEASGAATSAKGKARAASPRSSSEKAEHPKPKRTRRSG